MNTRPRTLMRAFASVLAVGVALGTAACSAPADEAASGNAPLRMATQPWLGYGAWYIAEEEGYFTERGLDVELTSFDADAEVNAALASGNVDVANVASHTALQFVENGVDVSIVLVLDAATTADAILADETITSIADLRGQEVAYEEGTTSDLLLNYALQQNDMSIDDIVKVPMGASEAGNALIAEKVPAAVTYEPYVTNATGLGTEVVYTAGELEGLISDVLVVRNDVLEERPDELRELLGAWGDSVDFYEANTDQGREIIAAGVGADAAELATGFDGVHLFTLEENKDFLDGEYTSEVLPTIIEVATVASILDGSVAPADVINSSLLP